MKKKNYLFLLILFVVFLGTCQVNAYSYEANKYVQVLAQCDLGGIPTQLPIFISRLINLFKIVAPIILVIMGLIDFLRAVISSDEKQMKESQSRFIKRIIAAVFIFFVIAIVQFVFSSIGTDGTLLGCVDCFVRGDC